MFSLTGDCHDCKPHSTYHHRLHRSIDNVPTSTLLLSSVPLVLTWIATVAVAHRRLFPILASDPDHKTGLPVFNRDVFTAAARYNWRQELSKRPSSQTLAAVVFSATMGLSAVLVELLLCEISNTLDPAARGLSLRITLTSLLVLILLVTPALEIHGITKTLLGSQPETTSTRRSKPTAKIVLELSLLASWLVVFWYIPQASILRSRLSVKEQRRLENETDFREACLERIGIIGVSLMASLAGFAAVSSLWQTFGVRNTTVKDAQLARKAAGLAATEGMLAAKQSKIRALQRKLSESNSPSEQTGFMSSVIGTFRSSGEAQELRALQMDIAGLEGVRFNISSSLANLQRRRDEQQRARTPVGRFLRAFNLAFAVYCAYRIAATIFSSLRRFMAGSPAAASSAADPINKLLAILTAHWDGELDRAAWARQISFLLSGFMLLASFNAVLQTFRLFARFLPALLLYAQTSLPLVISQIAGTYVISSALLLRSNLPTEVSNVITDALGAPLEGKFVEGWFESWFLVAVGLTAAGIVIGRKVGDRYDDDDDDWDSGGGAGLWKLS